MPLFPQNPVHCTSGKHFIASLYIVIKRYLHNLHGRKEINCRIIIIIFKKSDFRTHKERNIGGGYNKRDLLIIICVVVRSVHH